MKKQILLFCFLFFAMIGFAENVYITGVVTSAEDGRAADWRIRPK